MDNVITKPTHILLIWRGFKISIINSIEIMSKLIPRYESKFTLLSISIKETKDIIYKMRRHDSLSSHILKIVQEITAIYLTDCIDASICESVFPMLENFKNIADQQS